MKPPKWNQIQASDYKDAGPWFERFSIYLNQILQPIIQILNNNITVTDNLKYKTFDKNFTTSASYNSGSFDSFSFSCDFEPTLVLVGNCTSSNTAAPCGVVTKSYDKTAKQLTISYISNLNNSTNYDVTVVAI